MLVKVFLLPHYARFFYLESLCVLELDFSALLQDHMDDPIKVFIDLRHDFNLALLHFLPQICSLVNQILGAPSQRLKIAHDLFAIFLQDEH